tara:strand:+ start:122 stop:2434 length:2313 start_codon:yes stop_codon:yes gene_type:complete
MANPTIKIKRSHVSGKVPHYPSTLGLGEFAINTYDGKVFIAAGEAGVGIGTTVIEIGSGAGSLSNIVEDTTPQLGGPLDINGKYITGTGGAKIVGIVTANAFVGILTGNVTGNVTGNADTATSATSATTATNAQGITGTPDITVGAVTAGSLDISGNVDVDGTLETDGLTINGTTIVETIADTVGSMVNGNTESGITVAYQDADNTLDFTVGTLNQDTSGNAATATALENARTIGGVSFDGTANINLPGVNATGNQDTSGNAATATNATNVTGTIASAVTATTQSASDNTTKVATTAYVETAVSNLVDGSPAALNTLNELAAALGDDSNYATTTATSIGTKLPKSGGEMTGNITFSGSQTVDGRDVSADGSKLDGIAAGAEVNVQSDWNSSSGDNLILNKPTIPTNNNQLTNGAGYIVGSGVASLNHMGVTGVSTFSGNVRLSAQLQDGNGNFGTSGQVLTSDGTDTLWNDITFDSANLNVTGIATINHMRTVGVATFASLHSNLFSTGISTISGFRFPSSDGSEDQALVTDGSGNLSFKTLSGGGGGATGAATTISTGISTATQGQTAFTTPHPHNDGTDTYSHQVFVNGLKMRNQGGASTKDFTYSSNSTITFESPGLDAGDEYRAVVYFGHTLDEEFFTSTQGQTVFALTGSLTAQKNFKVYVNGVKLRNGTDYGVASPVTLVQAAQAGDHVEIVCDNAEDSFTATQGQTSFTPTSTDISSDNMQVYHNGLVLNLTGDYTIGSPSVTLTDGSGLNAGDQVDVVIRRT